MSFIRSALLPVRSSLYGHLIANKVKIDFSVIGFPKCATTSIHKTLGRVTTIHMPDYEVQVSSLTKGWLSLPDGKEMLGIKNPNIIYEPHNLLALYKSNKEMKFIISMRNPSDWLFSFYQYRMLEIREQKSWLTPYLVKHPEYREMTFDDIVYKQKSFLGVSIEAGFFLDYLTEVFKWIPSENILIIMLEEIAMEPEQAYLRVATFLGVDSRSEITVGVKANNKNKLYERRDEYLPHLSYLDDKYKEKNKQLNTFLENNCNYRNNYW